MSKIATFFGGAINDTTTKEYKDSIEIGKILAENRYVVKNGGQRGLMEAVSIGAHEENGWVHGVVCKKFGSQTGNDFLHEVTVADDIYDKLRYLIEESTVFVVQRGGIGTLAELFLVLDLIRKIKGEKPLVILFGEFWEEVMSGAGQLFRPQEHDLYHIVETIEQFELLINTNG